MNNETIKKLKIESYNDKLILNKPADIDEFEGLTYDVKEKKERYDLVVAFVFSLKEFTAQLKTVIAKELLAPNGYLYVVYPKKGNKQYKEYIGRDDFFGAVDMDKDGYVNGSPIKFAKMAAFNEVFTVVGLKHEAVKKDKSAQASQCVADYVGRIPDLQKYFARNKEVLTLFNKLTPGYQRDWARYVYSAKTDATVVKRLEEMEDILKQGYKTKDLYRTAKK